MCSTPIMNNMNILLKRKADESALRSYSLMACMEIPNPNSNEKMGKNFVQKNSCRIFCEMRSMLAVHCFANSSWLRKVEFMITMLTTNIPNTANPRQTSKISILLPAVVGWLLNGEGWLAVLFEQNYSFDLGIVHKKSLHQK